MLCSSAHGRALQEGQLIADRSCWLGLVQGTERSDAALHIFLEYVPGGSIASLLAKFGEQAGRPLSTKMITGVTVECWGGTCVQPLASTIEAA
jgi:hypothetical protein